MNNGLDGVDDGKSSGEDDAPIVVPKDKRRSNTLNISTIDKHTQQKKNEK
jgi:hypothetical protein